MGRNFKVFIAAALCIVFLLSGFVGGFVLHSRMNIQPVEKTEMEKQIDAVMKLMARDALEPSSETSATIGAIDGILKSNGDKYARYLPPTKFEQYTEQMEGQFGGMGVVLDVRDDTVAVLQVYENTPAEKAGVKKGDYFYAVDGETNEKWTVEEIQKRVKGKPGTKVKLTMMRPYKKGDTMNMRYPLGVPYDVTITRAVIETPISEASMKTGDIGYIRLFEFNRRATEEVVDQFTKLEKQGAKKFILDLRDNPGGDLSQAVGVSSLFIKDGPIVHIETRTSGKESLYATGEYLTDAPLVVLVDENSASASEIVSGALQDYKRAKLVGMKTYGKGSVQTQFEFGKGAVLFTTAHYLTPEGRVINNIGNSPDIEVPMSLDKQGNDKTDLQLQAAIKELNATN